MKIDTMTKIMIILFALFYLFLLDNAPAYILTDSETCILLAKSISLGQGFRQIWSPGRLPYNKLPPLFPLLLVPIIYLFGYNFLMMKLLCIIMAIGALWLIYLLFKKISDEFTALLILVLTGFSMQFVYFSQRILTEIPYAFFSFLAIIFIEKSKNKKNFFNQPLFFAIFFILLSYFTRYIGVSLIIAILIYFLFERNPQQNLRPTLKALTFLGLFLAIPILLWEISRGVNNAYLPELISVRNPLNLAQRLGFLEKIIHCIYAYVFYAYPKILTAIQFSHRNLGAFVFVLTAITFYGFLYCLIKKRTAAEYYIIFYMLILFSWVWSISAGARFLVPVIPFIFYYFIIGLRRILETIKIKDQIRKALLIFLIGILLLFNIKESMLFALDKERLRGYSQREAKDFLGAVKWIKDNTSPDSILASSVETQVYLYLGRKAIGISIGADAQGAIETVYNNKVNYVVVTPLFSYSKEYLEPILIKSSGTFIEVYRKNDSVIYKVKGSR